jgi:hypothetical protein
MSHTIKREPVAIQFATTRTLCLMHDHSQCFLKANIQNGNLKLGIHFVVMPGSHKRLWNVAMMKDWLVNGANSDAHQRAIERHLVSLPSHPDYNFSAA